MITIITKANGDVEKYNCLKVFSDNVMLNISFDNENDGISIELSSIVYWEVLIEN